MKFFPLLALIFTCASIHADVLEMKNGQIMNGKYAGGSANTVRFETGAGVQVIETAQVVALTFTTTGATAAGTTAAAAAPAAAAAAPAQPANVTIPSGTKLLVRMMDTVSSKNDEGSKFTTKLEYDLPSGNATALKGGTQIYGIVASSSQARRAVGKSTLDVRLNQIMISGQPQPVAISTSGYQVAGEASIKKAARGAAAGAAIGAIADDDAGKGAAIGATVGAIKKGETVTITPGTLLEFSLTQAVTVPAAK